VCLVPRGKCTGGLLWYAIMGNSCIRQDPPAAVDHGRRLDLSSKHLEMVPEDVGQDSSVTALDLSFNELANLPARLAKLTNLRYLLLRANQLKR